MAQTFRQVCQNKTQQKHQNNKNQGLGFEISACPIFQSRSNFNSAETNSVALLFEGETDKQVKTFRKTPISFAMMSCTVRLQTVGHPFFTGDIPKI